VALATPGEPARSLAADLVATYLGKHQFRIDDLELWDEETKKHRSHLIFHNENIRGFSAPLVMELRKRASCVSQQK
jgi:hypothetical protein